MDARNFQGKTASEAARRAGRVPIESSPAARHSLEPGLPEREGARSDRRAGRWFGGGGALLFGAAAARAARRGHAPLAAALAAAAVVLSLLAAFFPRGAWRVRQASMSLTSPLGWALSRTLLALVYLLGLAPAGALIRLFGKDPLERRREPGLPSYFSPARPRPPDHFRRPY